MIFGIGGLRKINAKIDLKSFRMEYKNKKVETREKINYVMNEEVEGDYRRVIDGLMKENCNSESIPFNTNVRATIRTADNEPIWTRQYPYPISANDFVNAEIDKLLSKKIIRPSQSPYNSPIWVVPKKGVNEDGTQKQRLVIDYQKLNSKTIADRYPMPDTNMILGNLGKARYFSTIDLESGYHQIMMVEGDKEKTAFSVNGAKYEFNRMPFGLKNAPSIFQRTIDDICRPYIGKFAHVYMDDVLVYSITKEEHAEHIEKIMNALRSANMKISDEKSKFFMTKVEFLGHIIANGKIRVDGKKVETIDNYPIPQSLRQLRSFLGLAGYYRKFVRDYAAITKPLTIFLQGENGMISARKSANIRIELDEQAKMAFEKIKEKLKENIELFQPDYKKPFELTTDASNYALGAVLSQLNRPIIFISRTLNKTERNYATNEKEALAIIWALKHLRNYIYGVNDLTIYTDHQPLTFAISANNPNLKIKRWKAMIEESGAKIIYRPGKQNVVADALSRQYCNELEDEIEETAHSRFSNINNDIPRTNEPLNAHRIQIELEEETNVDKTTHETIFPNHIRFHVRYKTIESAMRQLKLIIDQNKINAIHVPMEKEYEFVTKLQTEMPHIRFLFTRNKVRDITDRNEQIFLLEKEHDRAHRGAKENYAQLKQKYYWPTMKIDLRSYTVACKICLKNKYERNPKLQKAKQTPIPEKVGEMVHMDIFFLDKQKYLTCIDKFSKLINIFHIHSYTEIPQYIENLISIYPNINNVTTDNEATLNSQTVKSILNAYNITHHNTPVAHSTTNGQIERAHSTLLEIIRTLAEQYKETASNIIFRAVYEYNRTIHSVTRAKPIDIFTNSEKFPEVKKLLEEEQDRVIEKVNKKRINKEFGVGEKVYVRTDRRIKTKQKFNEHTVKENLDNVIIDTKNKKIHKDRIRK